MAVLPGTVDAEAVGAEWMAAARGTGQRLTPDGIGGVSAADFPLLDLTLDEVDEIGDAGRRLAALAAAGRNALPRVVRRGQPRRLRPQQMLDLRDADPGRLRTAAARLLERHPNLGAGFRYLASGRAVQVVPRSAGLDWRELAGADAEAVAAEERLRPFALAEPPLIRFTLFDTGDGGHRLLITSHHIVLDGWSAPLLGQELLELYRTGEPPKARPYRDYLDWLGRQDRETARAAWRNALSGLDGTSLLAPPGGELVGRGQSPARQTLGRPDRGPHDPARRVGAEERRHAQHCRAGGVVAAAGRG
ncbi:hypothetical protein DMP23_42770 [Amycolatopsis sp. A1MSW2902]|uniref:condensation domain-containing protein n=1 Tax=Amycolatopsis sp. A1MSW2902 TaxID=687413 RepID=UPI00307E4CA4